MVHAFIHECVREEWIGSDEIDFYIYHIET